MADALFPFRYRDPVTAKWVRARYRARLSDIRRRYATWELTGPAFEPPAATGAFHPYRKVMPHTEVVQLAELAPQLAPAVTDALERLLVQTFLRRYVTYCARRGRYAQMNGAARLLRALRATTR
jgi:hypothetical protein